MSRQVRTTLPQPTKHQWSYLPEFRRRNEEFKRKQKANFDLREAREIPDQVDVWVNTGTEPTRGMVTISAEQPRSYLVSTPSAGDIRRNRSQLNMVPSTEGDPESLPVPQPSPKRIMTRSRTGTDIAMPDYLRY